MDDLDIVRIRPSGLVKVGKIDDNKLWLLLKNDRELVIIYESEDERDRYFETFEKRITERSDKLEYLMTEKREHQISLLKEMMHEAMWKRDLEKMTKTTAVLAYAVLSSKYWYAKYMAERG